MLTRNQKEEIRQSAVKDFLEDVSLIVTAWGSFTKENIEEALALRQEAYLNASSSFIKSGDAKQKKVLFEYAQEIYRLMELYEVFHYMKDNHKEELETLLKGLKEQKEAAKEIIDKRFYDELNKGRS